MSKHPAKKSSDNLAKLLVQPKIKTTSKKSPEATSKKSAKVISDANVKVTSDKKSTVTSKERPKMPCNNSPKVASNTILIGKPNATSKATSRKALEVTSKERSKMTCNKTPKVASNKNSKVISKKSRKVARDDNSKITCTYNGKDLKSPNSSSARSESLTNVSSNGTPLSPILPCLHPVPKKLHLGKKGMPQFVKDLPGISERDVSFEMHFGEPCDLTIDSLSDAHFFTLEQTEEMVGLLCQHLAMSDFTTPVMHPATESICKDIWKKQVEEMACLPTFTNTPSPEEGKNQRKRTHNVSPNSLDLKKARVLSPHIPVSLAMSKSPSKCLNALKATMQNARVVVHHLELDANDSYQQPLEDIDFNCDVPGCKAPDSCDMKSLKISAPGSLNCSLLNRDNELGSLSPSNSDHLLPETMPTAQISNFVPATPERSLSKLDIVQCAVPSSCLNFPPGDAQIPNIVEDCSDYFCLDSKTASVKDALEREAEETISSEIEMGIILNNSGVESEQESVSKVCIETDNAAIECDAEVRDFGSAKETEKSALAIEEQIMKTSSDVEFTNLATMDITDFRCSRPKSNVFEVEKPAQEQLDFEPDQDTETTYSCEDSNDLFSSVQEKVKRMHEPQDDGIDQPVALPSTLKKQQHSDDVECSEPNGSDLDTSSVSADEAVSDDNNSGDGDDNGDDQLSNGSVEERLQLDVEDRESQMINALTEESESEEEEETNFKRKGKSSSNNNNRCDYPVSSPCTAKNLSDPRTAPRPTNTLAVRDANACLETKDSHSTTLAPRFQPRYCYNFQAGKCRKTQCQYVHELIPVEMVRKELCAIEESCKNGLLNKAFRDADLLLYRSNLDVVCKIVEMLLNAAFRLNQIPKVKDLCQMLKKHQVLTVQVCNEIVESCQNDMIQTFDIIEDIFRTCEKQWMQLKVDAVFIINEFFKMKSNKFLLLSLMKYSMEVCKRNQVDPIILKDALASVCRLRDDFPEYTKLINPLSYILCKLSQSQFKDLKRDHVEEFANIHVASEFSQELRRKLAECFGKSHSRESSMPVWIPGAAPVEVPGIKLPPPNPSISIRDMLHAKMKTFSWKDVADDIDVAVRNGDKIFLEELHILLWQEPELVPTRLHNIFKALSGDNNNLGLLPAAHVLTLASIATALTIEFYHKNLFKTAYEIQDTLRSFGVNYGEYVKLMIKGGLYPPEAAGCVKGIPVTPLTIMLTNASTFIHCGKPMLAYHLFQNQAWMKVENLNNESSKRDFGLRNQSLLKLCFELLKHHIHEGIKVLRVLLPTLDEDISSLLPDNYIEQFSDCYNSFLGALLNKDDVTHAFSLYTSSHSLLTVHGTILRAFATVYAELKDKQKCDDFLRRCIEGKHYAFLDSLLCDPHELNLPVYLTSPEVKLMINYAYENLFKHQLRCKGQVDLRMMIILSATNFNNKYQLKCLNNFSTSIDETCCRILGILESMGLSVGNNPNPSMHIIPIDQSVPFRNFHQFRQKHGQPDDITEEHSSEEAECLKDKKRLSSEKRKYSEISKSTSKIKKKHTCARHFLRSFSLSKTKAKRQKHCEEGEAESNSTELGKTSRFVLPAENCQISCSFNTDSSPTGRRRITSSFQAETPCETLRIERDTPNSTLSQNKKTLNPNTLFSRLNRVLNSESSLKSRSPPAAAPKHPPLPRSMASTTPSPDLSTIPPLVASQITPPYLLKSPPSLPRTPVYWETPPRASPLLSATLNALPAASSMQAAKSNVPAGASRLPPLSISIPRNGSLPFCSPAPSKKTPLQRSAQKSLRKSITLVRKSAPFIPLSSLLKSEFVTNTPKDTSDVFLKPTDVTPTERVSMSNFVITQVLRLSKNESVSRDRARIFANQFLYKFFRENDLTGLSKTAKLKSLEMFTKQQLLVFMDNECT